MSAVADLRDVRVLIPRTRRALQGPAGSATTTPGATLNDDEVTAIIADALSNIILYTEGWFGYKIEVVERDAAYLAPIAWRTNIERSEAADAVIVCQAALDYFFWTARNLKVHETIQDEGQSYDYDLSSSLIREQMKALQDARDRALQAVRALGAPMDAYVDFVSERDLQAARYLTPYTPEVGAAVPYQGGTAGGFDFDPRFGVWG